MLEMKVAERWRVPHSDLEQWKSRDVALSIAYLKALQDIGPCGLPHSKTTVPGFGDDYRIDGETVCEVCAKLEDFRNHEHPEPGAVVRVVNVWDDE